MKKNPAKRSGTARSLMMSALSLLLCISMLLGTTFAWFTDSVTSGKNRIVAGNLDIELKHYTNDSADAETVKEATDLFDVKLWEPGMYVYENFVLSNEGTLALKYDFALCAASYNTVTVDGVPHNLTEVLKVAVVPDGAFTPETRDEAKGLLTGNAALKTLNFEEALSDFTLHGDLKPKGTDGSSRTFAIVIAWPDGSNDNIYNINNGKTTSDGKPLYVDLGISAVATQLEYESDSFDEQYDKNLKTHDCDYDILPNGIWQCKLCGKVLEGTSGEYLMVLGEKGLEDPTEVVAFGPAAAALGFTIKEETGHTLFTYDSPEPVTIIIKTAGNDLLINAPYATVHHYGASSGVYLQSVSPNTFVGNGVYEDITILGQAHLKLAESASAKDVSVAKGVNPATVKITTVGGGDPIGVLAVYDGQGSIQVVKEDEQGEKETKLVSDKAAAEPNVVIVPNGGEKTARVGTTLYGSVQEAISAAGTANVVHLVNDEVILAPVEIKNGETLKISPFTTLTVEEDKKVNVQGDGMLINVGTILSQQESDANPVGLDVKGDLVNYGGLFDEQNNNEGSDKGGVLNHDGKILTVAGAVSNFGLMENTNGTVQIEATGKLGSESGIYQDGKDSVLKNEGKVELGTDKGDTKQTLNGAVENKGELKTSGDLETRGKLTNEKELEVRGSLTVSGEAENKGELSVEEKLTVSENSKMTNEGTVAATNIAVEGEDEKKGTLENKEGASIEIPEDGTIEGEIGGEGAITKEDAPIRVGVNFYGDLKTALAALKSDDKVVICQDIESVGKVTLGKQNESGDQTLDPIKNVVIDLNEHTLSGITLTMFHCDGVTVKNGNINGSIVIGEHVYTKIKWKHLNYGDNLYEAVYGYHPLAPATNILLENLNVVSASKPAITFTNIEDDLTRGAPTNYCDNDLYGRYVFKTGYTVKEQYIEPARHAEVFTPCSAKDSVTVKGGSYTAPSLTGNMVTYAGAFIDGVLTVSDGTVFHNDTAGRFIAEGSYLVGTDADTFTVAASAPETYAASTGKVYYTYAGGANDAIKFANIGETVYIAENADAAKELGQGDTFTVISLNDSAKWTGAAVSSKVEDPSMFEIIETPDEADPLKKVYSVKVIVVAEIYSHGDSRKDFQSSDTLKGSYGSLVDAFKASGAGDYIKLVRDVTIGKTGSLSGYSNYGLYLESRSVFDLNGHTLTYTGDGTAIFCTANSGTNDGSRAITDTSPGKTGKIVADNAYCFAKYNSKTEKTIIRGGTFISNKKNAIYINQCCTFSIEGGTFISNTTNAISVGSIGSGGSVTISGGTFSSPSTKACITGFSNYTITGGTFNVKPTSKVSSSKSVVENSDGTWTVQ